MALGHPVTLDDKINDVNHEIAIREIVFAKRVRLGFLDPAVAEYELAMMEKVLQTLKGRRDQLTAGVALALGHPVGGPGEPLEQQA